MPSAPQLVATDADRVAARIADRVAVGVRRALVDRQVVAGRQRHRRRDVVDRHRLRGGVPASPSESVACAETRRAAGPSGKVQSKLPAAACSCSTRRPSVPLAPQLGRDRAERVLARIGDRVAVGVRRALVRPTGRCRPTASTVGATLLTVTVCVAVLPASPSESVACTETVELAGPSGKVQSKLPHRVRVRSASTCVPFAPQLGRDRGDRVLARIADRVAVGVRRALVDREVVRPADSVTVGATLLTVTDCVAVSPVSPSESVDRDRDRRARRARPGRCSRSCRDRCPCSTRRVDGCRSRRSRSRRARERVRARIA